MKRLSRLFFALALIGVSGVTLAADTVRPYALRHGDSVLVSVWKEEALQKEVKVLPDGSITFPLAGRVEVAGLSSVEVEKLVAEKLKEYIPDPVVTVVIIGIEGSRAYILGKVAKPGPIPLNIPMTVLQALGYAGGIDKFADTDGIKVLRVGAKGRQVFPVHYNDLIKGRELEANIELEPGDTILVP